MIQLYQAEWCPFSKIVRQRLTELGVDYVIRQVAPFPEDRDALREATGIESTPVASLGASRSGGKGATCRIV